MKIIAVHPGKQHSFQLATALNKKGMLKKYITSVYVRRGSFSKQLLKFAKGDLRKKIGTRKCANIPDEKVVQFNETGVVATLFFNRIPYINYFAEKWNYFIESSFYKKVMKFVRKHKPDAVIYYNGYADKHLSMLAKSDTVKIMDVSIGHRLYLQKILDREIQETGITQIKTDHFSYWDDKMIDSDLKGCKETDYFLAASNFVKQSLIENGIAEKQIKLVPYGVNVDQFAPKNEKVLHQGETLKLLYVGSISYRKGIHRLINVVKALKNTELYLAGGYNSDSNLYKDASRYGNIHFLGFVTRDRLNEIYNQSHVFVLPSFCEGMAMVGLEAMSAGLPIICTTNTGVNDAVVDGENGFVYSPNDEIALAKHIEWFKNNPTELNRMSHNARETSLNYTWDIYHENVVNAITECINSSRK